MKFNEFKRARKLIIENKAEKIEQIYESELYDFVSAKYDDQLNEGIFSSIIGWFKRNFSPKASKLKKLAKEYYAWLQNEFTAQYKGGDDETALERFYKTEKVSDDIEDQMLDAAGDDEDYKKLADALILEYKVLAKKDFASKMLGSGNNLSKQLEGEYRASSSRVNELMSTLSKDDTIQFKKDLKDLKDYIKKTGKWSDSLAGTLASGIMAFAQNRKNENYVSMNIEELQKEYDKGESPWFSVNSKMKDAKGVDLMFSIRALTGDPELMKKNKLTGKDIAEEVNNIMVDLKDAGVDVETQWGYADLYLKQTSVDERKTVLKKIAEAVKSRSTEENIAAAEKIGDTLDGADGADASQVNQIIDDAEKELESKPETTSGTDKEDDEETSSGSKAESIAHFEEEEEKHQKEVVEPTIADLEKEKAKDPKDEKKIAELEELVASNEIQTLKLKLSTARLKAEEAGKKKEEDETYKSIMKELLDKTDALDAKQHQAKNPVSEDRKKIVNKLQDEANSLVFAPLRDIIITLGTAKPDERGKLVFDEAIKNNKTQTALKIPVDPEKKGIPAEYVETAKKYITKLNDADIIKSDLDEKTMKEAGDSILKDIDAIAARSPESAKAITELSDEDMVFFILRLLNDKKLGVEPTKAEDIEKVFAPTIKHYGL